LLRALLVCGTAVEIAVGIDGQPFYLSALVVVSVNRFILSGLSAALPHVIDPGRLVTATALSTTAGAVVTALGGGVAIGVRALAGGGNNGSAVIAVSAAVGYLLAALVATGFSRTQLGPTEEDRDNSDSVRRVVAGMIAGARHIYDRPPVFRALSVIAVHRFAYGISLIMTLLLYRNYFSDQGFFRAGLPGLAQLVAAVAVGGGAAAFVTPWAARRFGYIRWPAALLVAAGALQWCLGLPFELQTFLPAAALLGFAAQSIKISVDTVVAQQVDDNFRGRVFSLYDTLFNLLFVSAAVVTAVTLPETGRSTAAVLFIGATYLFAGAFYLRQGELPTATVRQGVRTTDGIPSQGA
jgi:hypothetical protein